MSRLAYRKDIDGLRAVAVLLVVAFHFGIAPVRGGYLGVDLFFVISGYLISSLFAREPAITGPVLAAFYARRIKRLLPAFVVVACATTVAAAVLMLPDDFEAYLRSVRQSFLFSANVLFDRETNDYFATSAAEMPWLHTWSLSIEWQFYAVFPFVVWLLRRLPSERMRVAAIAGAVFVGVLLSTWIVAARPHHAYFSATARAFEFLAGALAASLPLAAIDQRTARWVSAAGVAALLTLAVVFGRDTPFPGLAAALVASIGVVLIVVGRVASILASDALAWIGRRSYAAYLWHWPVVAFLHYVQHEPGAVEIALWLIAIAVASDLTWRFVEKPGVASARGWPTTVALYCIVPLLVSSALYPWVKRHDGFPARLGAESVHATENLKAFASSFLVGCHDRVDADIAPCVLGDPRGARHALLIGDSHARHFEPFVRVLAEAASVQVHALTDSECLVLETADAAAAATRTPACNAAIARDFALIRSRRFDYVLIAERWIGYPGDRLDRLDGTVRTIVDAGAIPVLFKPVAEDGRNTKDCFNRHLKMRIPYGGDCTIATVDDYAIVERRRVDAVIDAVAARYPTVKIVDPRVVQCDARVCTTIIDGTPIYADTHHLDGYGSTMLGRAWLASIGNPFDSQASGSR